MVTATPSARSGCTSSRARAVRKRGTWAGSREVGELRGRKATRTEGWVTCAISKSLYLEMQIKLT